MQRPYGLSDQAQDLVSGSGTNGVTILFDPGSSYYDYKLLLTGSMSGGDQTIDQGGNPISTGHTGVITTGNQGYVRRPISIPGKYSDHIITYYSSNGVNGDFKYSYFVFQKAVAILKLNGNIVNNGYSTTGTVNDVINVDTGLARGNDVVSNLSVQVKDSFGNWNPGVLNSDYQIISVVGTLTQIKLLQVAAYRVVLNISGYTSSNNPFGVLDLSDANRQLCYTNDDNTSFVVDASAVTHVEVITIPTISVNLTAVNPIAASPLTCYTNQSITAQGVVNYGSGVWLIDGTPKATSNSDWDNEIASAIKVTLNVYDNNGILVQGPFKGLGPFNILLKAAGTYNIKFITST